ncbi:hypothetical protein PTTG_26545 [Puccinia triticina 1-1 BBBD Race 1]|uniref:DUF6589 domain-containing protein n=2 Tax=Puccinia triticina TaxID=208348 RepID=A0A180GT06_PUCT1|nr:hypothetical protein PTTG_26545 [Puccinia triticina 1-1 BBBD Race 1]
MIINQIGLKPEEFCSRVQLIDGDLGTSQNFNSLRTLRTPSNFPDHRLHNISFQLGASHTLWNIAQSILTAHFGDQERSNDLGAWQYLHALGIPPEKAIPKKDFTSMINNIEKVHEATIFYCLRLMMGTENEPIPNVQPKIATTQWNETIEACYTNFFSPKARRATSRDSSPKLHALLLRLHDFSTVVEANRAMKAGDIGRVMKMWKIWSIMTQALPGLVNYRSYLPCMVLLLQNILPPDVSKYILHTLLMSPSGRQNHFVAKDYYLELQNYSLKFLYNQTGFGTRVERLQEIFLLNMNLLRSMFLSLRMERGGRLVYQSHKNDITTQSLEMFVRMARNEDITDKDHKDTKQSVPDCKDLLLEGLKVLQNDITSGKISRLKLHFFWDAPAGELNQSIVQEDPTDLEEEDHEENEQTVTPETCFEM